ncbi:probable WRKY transcription factor protein 1, partial [Agrilus planipennis]|uniref:Probable WRKY transcription factor protein 1 n=1 Tax=Agrilus planipennis TaxID=224129 RepID=A0A1W4XQX4_AGRPL
ILNKENECHIEKIPLFIVFFLVRHSLAQQRSDSWDNVNVRVPDSRIHSFPSGVNCSSDPLLNRNKKDSGGCMRKSTLLRRFFGSIKQFPESKNFGSTEWQFYRNKKSFRSPPSFHCSQELTKSQSRGSLNNLPTVTTTNSKQKQPLAVIPPEKIKRKICSVVTNREVSSPTSSSNIPNFSSKDQSKPSTEIYSTTTTPRNYLEMEKCTSAFDTSDSAYTKTAERSTDASITASNTSIFSFRLPRRNNSSNNNNDDDDNNNNDDDDDDETLNESTFYSSRINSNKNTIQSQNTDNNQTERLSEVIESSTQTNDTSNLNVISNVQLSRATLEAIFTHVLKDVQNIKSATNSTSATPAFYTVPLKTELVNPTPKTIHVKQFPVFNIKPENIKSPIPKNKNKDKHVLTNIELDKNFADEKPSGISVPRYSAVPESSSMDVNASSEDDLTDNDSDVLSIADSLEEQKTPKNGDQKRQYTSEEWSPLLPDNSHKHNVKSASFFIPMGTKNVATETKPVADHLPKKVKEKLSRRQLRRIQKQRQSKRNYTSSKSDSNYVSASENGKSIYYSERHKSVNDNLSSNIPSESDTNFARKRRKPELPSIDFMRRNRSERLPRKNKNIKKEVEDATNEIFQQNSSHSISHNSNSNKNQKIEAESLGRRIEILQIVECVDSACLENQSSKHAKSKIPVMVAPKISKSLREYFPKIDQKPVYLSATGGDSQDSKIDQLIANILIDALNQNDSNTTFQHPDSPKLVKTTYKFEALPTSARQINEKYKQTFEAIPEEKSSSTISNEESINNASVQEEQNLNKPASENAKSPLACNNCNKSKPNENYKGKAAIAGVKDENFTSIPKGWITFYMLHKGPDSPESTSEEGSKSNKKKAKKTKIDIGAQIVAHTKSKEATTESPPMEQSHEEHGKSKENCKNLAKLDNDKRPSKEESETNVEYSDSATSEDGWSLTFSTSSKCGKFPENLQMRFKILRSSCQNCHHTCSCSKSTPRDRNVKFPPLQEKERNQTAEKIDLESVNNHKKVEHLPKIIEKQKAQANDKMKKKISEPRQNKASTYRMALKQNSVGTSQQENRYNDD